MPVSLGHDNVRRRVVMDDDLPHGSNVELVAWRVQVVGQALQLGSRSALTRRRTAPCRRNTRPSMPGSAYALVLLRYGCAAAHLEYGLRRVGAGPPAQAVQEPYPGAASVRTAGLFRAASGMQRCIASIRKCRGYSVRTTNSSSLFTEIGAVGNTASSPQTAVQLEQCEVFEGRALEALRLGGPGAVSFRRFWSLLAHRGVNWEHEGCGRQKRRGSVWAPKEKLFSRILKAASRSQSGMLMERDQSDEGVWRLKSALLLADR